MSLLYQIWHSKKSNTWCVSMLSMSLAYTTHPLFYIITIFITVRFLQRFFQNRIGFGITFTTPSFEFFGKLYASQPHIALWRTKIQELFHSHTKQLWASILRESTCHQFSTTTTALVLPKVIIASVWLILKYHKVGKHVKVTVVSCQQECIYCFCCETLWITLIYLFTDMQSK